MSDPTTLEVPPGVWQWLEGAIADGIKSGLSTDSLTKREQIAAMVLAGMMTNPYWDHSPWDRCATSAVAGADSLLAKLAEPQKPDPVRDAAPALLEALRRIASQGLRSDNEANFLGGYSTDHDVKVFRHGMCTGWNVSKSIAEAAIAAATGEEDPR